MSLSSSFSSFVDFWKTFSASILLDLLFNSKNFPIFFIFQVISICVAVRRFGKKFEWYQSYLIAAFMSLFGRVLTAFITQRNPPLLEEPLYVPVFTILWFLVNCSPRDFFYMILSTSPFAFILELIYALVQVRDCTCGVDIGYKCFPQGAVGAILVSVIMSSTPSFVWLLFESGARQFSNRTILRNLGLATAYFHITHRPEYFGQYINTDKDIVKVYALVLYITISLIDQIVFGWRGRGEIDITLLTYIGILFEYTGNK